MADWEEREKEEIELDEGRRSKAYKDSLGNWTIGVGHLLHADEAEWSEEKIDDVYEADFQRAIDAAKKAVPFFDALDGPRKGALVNMAFNMGAATLASFHGTLAAMDNADWQLAAKNLMNSKYARQVGNRAKRIAYRIRTGEYSLRG